ncbi:hypothetical protein ELI_0105 [Eubacterium callanderi]|uniref:Uncharacterized protein n=1 Tax=Eubacterium callanderi TaxID=53442 RepID=E3GHH2_9FIRM|nr:hypothetical protein ELI_0105 [Eubacterium callanderi]
MDWNFSDQSANFLYDKQPEYAFNRERSMLLISIWKTAFAQGENTTSMESGFMIL